MDSNYGMCVFNPPNQNVNNNSDVLKGVYPFYDSATDACSNHLINDSEQHILTETTSDPTIESNLFPILECTHANAKPMPEGKYGPWFSCPDCKRKIGKTFKDGNPNPAFDRIIEQKLNRKQTHE